MTTFDMDAVMFPDEQAGDLDLRELEGKRIFNFTKAALAVNDGNTQFIVWELALVSTVCNLFSLVVVFLLQRQFGKAIALAKT